MKRKIAGILMIVLSVGALGFWELWGRENISYRTVAVLRNDLEAHTVITRDMLKPKKVEVPAKGSVTWQNVGKLIGLETRQFTACDRELHMNYFGEPGFRTGETYDRYVLSVPDTWLLSWPESMKRGDRTFIYLGSKAICETRIIHVKDSYGQEITYDDKDRFYPSGRIEEIEIIVSSGQMEKLNNLALKGNRFTLIYAEDTDDDTV